MAAWGETRKQAGLHRQESPQGPAQAGGRSMSSVTYHRSAYRRCSIKYEAADTKRCRTPTTSIIWSTTATPSPGEHHDDHGWGQLAQQTRVTGEFSSQAIQGSTWLAAGPCGAAGTGPPPPQGTAA